MELTNLVYLCAPITKDKYQIFTICIRSIMKKYKSSFVLSLMLSAILFIVTCSGTDGNKWMPEILSEKFQKDHYLPDYSYAGYHWGESPLPNAKANLNVTTFGAVPDDGKDDTEALLKAFAEAHEVDGPVVVKFPKGKFILKKILYINRSDFIVRGAGSGRDGTILYCPQPLSDLETPESLKELEEYLTHYNKIQHIRDLDVKVPFSLYAWSGGFIWTRVKGKRFKPYMEKYNTPPNILATIKSGKTGEHLLNVDSTEKLKSGDIVSIYWYNKEGEKSTLIDEIYDHQSLKVGSRHWQNPNYPLTTQEATIIKIEGNQVTIKEPLLLDLRPEYTPVIAEWKHIKEVGIEHLRFDFPYDLYNGHHVQDGYSAIFLTSTAHSWVKDIKIHNGDNGILADDCANITIENVETTGRTYHYTVMLGLAYNFLCKNITVNAPCVHSLSFNTGARRCVFTDCDVKVQPTLDQHSGCNFQNLFDNIRIIDKEPHHSFITAGGAGYWKPTHGAFSTFWNIQNEFDYCHPADKPIKIKGVMDGPSARLVGLTANYPIDITYGPNTYMEGINKSDIAVPSLYEYQLKKRLAE
ncbi:hypothetical protein GF337_17435 [candidate division KSB1 bacterium]|nr:hypothetical protein [candidate division KSB1 bacterium]